MIRLKASRHRAPYRQLLGRAKRKKIKAKVVSVRCRCGYGWTAIFPSGVLRRLVNCPACRSVVKTSGEPTPRPDCIGCGRVHKKTPCEFCAHE